LLRRVVGVHCSMDRIRDVLGLIFLAGMLSPLVSATVGTLSLFLSGTISAAQILITWRSWWLGDFIGDVVIAPLLLAWGSRGSSIPARPPWMLEAVALVVSLLALSLFLFRGWPLPPPEPFRHPYVELPLLIWAVLRFGQRGAVTATFLITMIAIWCTVLGFGPFSYGPLHARLAYLQVFISILAITLLLLGAALAERERALKMRDEFLAIVSHDLKSPLTSMSLNVELLRTRVAQPESERVNRPLAVLQSSLTKMNRLINDLLDLASIEAGSLSIVRRDHDAGTLLGEAIEMQRLAAGEKAQVLRAIAPAPGLRVHCDWDRALQVLSNLIGNAIKFTPQGGTITVGAEASGPVVRWWVTDSGPGIAPEHLSHIFSRFWRLNRADRRGSGLGLAIAKSLVEAHGGRIWVESRVERGSSFYFTLPRAYL
jgi:signal transduction histidine kinase